MYHYLTMLKGPRTGSHFNLDANQANLIGRGLDCKIVLTDPLCSRVHCELYKTPDGWMARDHRSRNGTYLNGQKIDEARLVSGAELRIGSVVFEFRETGQRPGDTSRVDVDRTQTVIHDRPLSILDLKKMAGEYTSSDRKPETGLILQMTVKLLGCDDPDEVIRIGLESLRERSKADVAGILWVSDDGQLKPKLVMPADQAAKVVLSDELTEKVCRESKAVWIDNHTAANNAAASKHYADAICVPLMHEKQIVGAVHIYKETDRFNEAAFEHTINLAGIITIALVRAREHSMLKADHNRLVDKSAAFGELIGESKPMAELKSRISRMARATGCVLVRGESGAGKELVARAIHKASFRSDRPMLSVNCAAIPRDLMESQLFGHKKGSFTGAEADHIGWFEQANTGTLFLDEVGEMTLDGQAKLLRILEGHPFLPVGSVKEITVDVRVIAATNRDLREFVREGKFREDLYYRLSVFELYIPPLRDRGEDIGVLLDFFLRHFKQQHGRPQLKLSAESREKLLSYRWPGNVRQLRNVIDSAVVLAESEEITPGDLGLRDVSPTSSQSAPQNSSQFDTLRIDVWERRLINEAMKRTNESVPEASRLLGMGRATLYRKLDEYKAQAQPREGE